MGGSHTLLTEGHVPEEVYKQVRTQFSEEELVNLASSLGEWSDPRSYQQGFGPPTDSSSYTRIEGKYLM